MREVTVDGITWEFLVDSNDDGIPDVILYPDNGVTTGIKEEDEWINNYLNIGITWFVESIWPGRWSGRDSLDNIKKIISRGPPLIK